MLGRFLVSRRLPAVPRCVGLHYLSPIRDQLHPCCLNQVRLAYVQVASADAREGGSWAKNDHQENH
jgi:hypothetical protein